MAEKNNFALTELYKYLHHSHIYIYYVFFNITRIIIEISQQLQYRWMFLCTATSRVIFLLFLIRFLLFWVFVVLYYRNTWIFRITIFGPDHRLPKQLYEYSLTIMNNRKLL